MDTNEDQFDLGTGLTVITIVLDEAENAPRIDLGDCPPHIAIQIFEDTAELLRSMMPTPTVTYMGNIIAQPFYIDIDEDEEEW